MLNRENKLFMQLNANITFVGINWLNAKNFMK